MRSWSCAASVLMALLAGNLRHKIDKARNREHHTTEAILARFPVNKGYEMGVLSAKHW